MVKMVDDVNDDDDDKVVVIARWMQKKKRKKKRDREGEEDKTDIGVNGFVINGLNGIFIFLKIIIKKDALSATV